MAYSSKVFSLSYRMNQTAIPAFLKAQKSHAAYFIHIAIGLGLAAGFLLILQAYFLAKIINAVVFENQVLANIHSWLWLMLVIFILRAILSWASNQIAFCAAIKVKRQLRKEVHTHIQALGPVYLKSERSGEIVTTLIEGIEALQNYYAKFLPIMSLVVLLPLSILAFIFPLDWVSGLIMLVTAPLIPVFMVLIGKGTERLNKQQWRKLARMSAHFLDMVQGLTTLKLFNVSRREAGVVAQISDEYRRNTMSVLRVAFLSSLMLEFLATISIALVAVAIGFRLFYGEMDFFYGFFVLLLAPEFYLPLRNMGTHYHARLEAIGAAEKIVEILNTPLPETLAKNTQPNKINPLKNTKKLAITFKNISFSYEKGRKALNNISFKLEDKQRVAIVGTSGAGKSTLTNLLLGFIQPCTGEILINDIPLHEINVEVWRQHIAWVPQTPHLFHGTIRDNIALGNDSPSEQAIQNAAKKSHADIFIKKLPDAYHTITGERGAGLSGGEMQRIALARAFLKNAPLFIFDEATANLDTESEELIQDSINKLALDRSVLVIAHRLSTVKYADLILVMDDGNIVEQGTHQQLAQSSGLYQEMLTIFEEEHR